MPADTTAAPVTTEAAPTAPATATPAASAPADEASVHKREALKLAASERLLKQRLAAYEKADRDRGEAEKLTAAERAAEEKLREEDPRAWLEKKTGLKSEDLARRLNGKPATPDAEAKREIEALKAQLADHQRALDEKFQGLTRAQQEASEANAYRMVLGVAKAGPDDPALALAAQEMAADPRGSARWVTSWAERDWPKYAAENGLDPSDSHAAAAAAAKVIGEKALARARALVQNPTIAKALGFGAPSQQPTASQGAPPRTIDAAIAASRGTGTPDKPLSSEERKSLLRKNAERVALEMLNKG
jgi:hypothetical protein